jgi:hypothetical protein
MVADGQGLARRLMTRQCPAASEQAGHLLGKRTFSVSNDCSIVQYPTVRPPIYARFMKDAFNPDFFVATATIIPVLFLAIAVQGSMFKDLLTVFSLAVRENFGPAARRRTFVTMLLSSLLIAGAILIMGYIGELIAIDDLLSRHSDLAWFVGFSAKVLMGLVVVGPAIRFWNSGRELMSQLRVMAGAIRFKEEIATIMEPRPETDD